MRLHIVGLPHTVPTDAYSWCAYTQKMRRFCEMCKLNGWEPLPIWGQDMGRTIPPFDANTKLWQDFNTKAIETIRASRQPDDWLCLMQGVTHKVIADAIPDIGKWAVEPGVGYTGVYTNFRAYESYAWMHTIYGGSDREPANVDGRNYDSVIPNAYREEEFPLGTGNGGYYLYIGRLMQRKGMFEVFDIVARTGIQLKIAGLPGDFTLPNPLPKNVEYVGVVEPEARAELMGKAIATLVPTRYIGPFEGVHAESLMCGTPVISTDWGVFTETIENGVNGFRCRTLAEFAEAVEKVKQFNRGLIHRAAHYRFGINQVRHQFAHWFKQLEIVRHGAGWYA